MPRPVVFVAARKRAECQYYFSVLFECGFEQPFVRVQSAACSHVSSREDDNGRL